MLSTLGVVPITSVFNRGRTRSTSTKSLARASTTVDANDPISSTRSAVPVAWSASPALHSSSTSNVR